MGRPIAGLEASIQSFADAIPTMLWIAGPDAQHIFFNKTWLAFRGRGLDEETGSGWIEGVHSDDRPACIESYLRAFRSRESFERRYRLRRSNGEYHWVLDRGSPWRHDDGRFLGFVGTTEMITIDGSE